VGEFNLTTEQLRYYMEIAETIPGETTRKIEEHTGRYKIEVLFGMVEKSTVGGGSVLYNSAVYIGVTGLKGVYRKIHLPGDEVHLFNPGNSLPVFQSRAGAIGIQVCWDIASPEVSRVLALKGAAILCFTTAWPMQSDNSEDDAWGRVYDVWTRVRAMENQSWLLAANQVGQCARSGWHYFGHSCIVSPEGKITSEIDDREGMIVQDIDVQEEILKTKMSFLDISNILRDRKPAVYAPVSDERIYYPPYEFSTG
jgi:predicted amidohydrolase